MSKTAPPPGKPNFLSTALLMVAVFLLVQMWFNPQKNQPTGQDKKPLTNSGAVLAELKRIDSLDAKTVGEANGYNDEANRLLPSYKNFLDEDLKAKKIDEAQVDDAKTQASILAAHIQLKNGIASRDTNKLRMAYNTLEPFERTHSDKAAWKSTPVEVTDKGQKVQVTGHAFLGQLVDAISERNKSDYIWGFIPGGYQFVDFLVGLTGHNPYYSYAFATLLLAFVVRAVVFPLSQKQLMMSRQMSQLTPRLAEIKEKFKDEPTEMNRRSMELYSRYGINPFAGCLPALVQMPLFLTVYQCILHYQFEFTRGYFLWINPSASQNTHGFFAPNLGQQDYLLIVIYAITMVISTLLTPVTDPTQAKQQRMIGLAAAVIFPVMMLFRFFPVVSGFVLYWTFTNLFSMAQSLRAYRLPMPALVEVNAPGGGVFPGKPKGKWAQIMEDMQKAAEDQQRMQKGPQTDPKGPKSNGKISPSRPIDDKKDGGSGGTGTPAKHKPKKRK